MYNTIQYDGLTLKFELDFKINIIMLKNSYKVDINIIEALLLIRGKC